MPYQACPLPPILFGAMPQVIPTGALRRGEGPQGDRLSEGPRPSPTFLNPFGAKTSVTNRMDSAPRQRTINAVPPNCGPSVAALSYSAPVTCRKHQTRAAPRRETIMALEDTSPEAGSLSPNFLQPIRGHRKAVCQIHNVPRQRTTWRVPFHLLPVRCHLSYSAPVT